ncbi:MAG TPA: vanadium-dependent haloperoxidase [Gemmataceae bacterium]|nr:vanadium-dependent haloperoxidase [Gemmataceae bacterium]
MVLVKHSRLRVEPLEDRSLPSAAFVPEWNDLLVDVQQRRAQGNQQAARALAMMGAAVYDSVNAVDPTHTVYHVDAKAFPGVATASADAAAVQAAHDVAYALYNRDTERPRIDDLLDTHLDELVAGGVTGIAEGIALGHHVAAQVLAWRASDGSNGSVPYTIGTQPGDWQPTPPAFNPNPSTPHWGSVTPFALDEGSQFRAGPPPALTSPDYTEAFLEVKDLGRIDSTTRSPEQTEIALYWATAGVGLWNEITETVAAAHDLTLAENARLFAQVHVANADAFIASYDTKYTYNFWRPVTAIRAADTDGNPDTVPDSTWTPLIATPNHPSYGSNHSTQSRAAAEALAAFFGTDRVGFTATSAGIERSYTSFTEAAKEGGMSRVYAGIHWSFDCAVTEALGRKVGRYVADHYFRPVDGSGDLLQAAAAPLTPVHTALGADQVRPLLVEALTRWQAAGVDVSALRGVEVRIADLSGLTLGVASGNTIWLDDDAAGWGWFVDQSPWDDSEFAAPGDQGEQDRMDLLTALEHELGHLLGRDHTAGGVMEEALAAGTRRTVTPVATHDVQVGGFMLFGADDDFGTGDVARIGKRK